MSILFNGNAFSLNIEGPVPVIVEKEDYDSIEEVESEDEDEVASEEEVEELSEWGGEIQQSLFLINSHPGISKSRQHIIIYFATTIYLNSLRII